MFGVASLPQQLGCGSFSSCGMKWRGRGNVSKLLKRGILDLPLHVPQRSSQLFGGSTTDRCNLSTIPPAGFLHGALSDEMPNTTILNMQFAVDSLNLFSAFEFCVV